MAPVSAVAGTRSKVGNNLNALVPIILQPKSTSRLKRVRVNDNDNDNDNDKCTQLRVALTDFALLKANHRASSIGSFLCAVVANSTSSP